MKFLYLFAVLFLFDTNIPILNQKIIEYVDTVIGKKVKRGECWDLAAEALDHAGAYLDRSSQKSIYIFGEKLNPKKDKIYPGDIIQIENAKLQYTKDNGIYTETMTHHTAIVYEVSGKDQYKIAHQNTSFSGKKVGISNFNTAYIIKGSITFYRPYKK